MLINFEITLEKLLPRRVQVTYEFYGVIVIKLNVQTAFFPQKPIDIQVGVNIPFARLMFHGPYTMLKSYPGLIENP